jgi:hypothetical protein
MNLEEYLINGIEYNAARDSANTWDVIKDYKEIEQRGVYRGYKCLKMQTTYTLKK